MCILFHEDKIFFFKRLWVTWEFTLYKYITMLVIVECVWWFWRHSCWGKPVIFCIIGSLVPADVLKAWWKSYVREFTLVTGIQRRVQIKRDFFKSAQSSRVSYHDDVLDFTFVVSKHAWDMVKVLVELMQCCNLPLQNIAMLQFGI